MNTTNLVGTEIYYSGDNANMPYFGTITEANERYLTIKTEEGVIKKGFFTCQLNDGSKRLMTKEAYLKDQKEKIKLFQLAYQVQKT